MDKLEYSLEEFKKDFSIRKEISESKTAFIENLIAKEIRKEDPYSFLPKDIEYDKRGSYYGLHYDWWHINHNKKNKVISQLFQYMKLSEIQKELMLKAKEYFGFESFEDGRHFRREMLRLQGKFDDNKRLSEEIKVLRKEKEELRKLAEKYLWRDYRKRGTIRTKSNTIKNKTGRIKTLKRTLTDIKEGRKKWKKVGNRYKLTG